MTEQEQRQLLHRHLWKLAENVRGAVDGWDFKQYILGILFYRFISDKFKAYMEIGDEGDEGVDYETIDESLITDELKDDTIKTKGYFIMPKHLFSNLVKTARTNDNLNIDLREALEAIQSSALGYPSELAISGLFDDVDTKNNRLGATVAERNQRLADILEGIANIDFGIDLDFEDYKIDVFGDAYEYLIGKYASNAGKSGGEFFTPQKVSKLLSNIVMIGKDENNKINKI